MDPLNRLWAGDLRGRFKKRRELIWLSSDALLGICRESPERLWKRVRQLEGLEPTIRDIVSHRATSP